MGTWKWGHEMGTHTTSGTAPEPDAEKESEDTATEAENAYREAHGNPFRREGREGEPVRRRPPTWPFGNQ